MAYYNDWNPERAIEKDPIGRLFEKKFIEILNNTFTKSSRYSITNTLDTKLDHEQGTDFLINDIHADGTLNFGNKECMPFVYDTEIEAIPGQNFMIGIRHGHHHKGVYYNFEEPAIVVGLTLDSDRYTPSQLYDLYSQDLYDSLKNNIRNIIYAMENAKNDYEMTNQAEREEEFVEHVLEPNENYDFEGHDDVHKKLLKKYKNSEAFQFTLNTKNTKEDLNEKCISID